MMSRCGNFTVGAKASKLDTRRLRVMSGNQEICRTHDVRASRDHPVTLTIARRDGLGDEVEVLFDGKTHTPTNPAQWDNLLDMQTMSKSRIRDWPAHPRFTHLVSAMQKLDPTLGESDVALLLSVGVSPQQLEMWQEMGFTDTTGVLGAARHTTATEYFAWKKLEKNSGTLPSPRAVARWRKRGFTVSQVSRWASALLESDPSINYSSLADLNVATLLGNNFAVFRFFHAAGVSPRMLARETSDPDPQLGYFKRLVQFVQGVPGASVVPYDYVLADTWVNLPHQEGFPQPRVRLNDLPTIDAAFKSARAGRPIPEVVDAAIGVLKGPSLVGPRKLSLAVSNGYMVTTAAWSGSVRAKGGSTSPLSWAAVEGAVMQTLRERQCPTVRSVLSRIPSQRPIQALLVAENNKDFSSLSATEIQTRLHFYLVHKSECTEQCTHVARGVESGHVSLPDGLGTLSYPVKVDDTKKAPGDFTCQDCFLVVNPTQFSTAQCPQGNETCAAARLQTA